MWSLYNCVCSFCNDNITMLNTSHWLRQGVCISTILSYFLWCDIHIIAVSCMHLYNYRLYLALIYSSQLVKHSWKPLPCSHAIWRFYSYANMKAMIFSWARCYVLAAQMAQVVSDRVRSMKCGLFTPVLFQHFELCFIVLLTMKHGTPYCKTLHCSISFSLLHSAILAIWCSRTT